MPIFEPDFSSVDAGFPIFDKGRYQVQVTKRTGFIKESKPNDQVSVSASTSIVSDEKMRPIIARMTIRGPMTATTLVLCANTLRRKKMGSVIASRSVGVCPSACGCTGCSCCIYPSCEQIKQQVVFMLESCAL